MGEKMLVEEVEFMFLSDFFEPRFHEKLRKAANEGWAIRLDTFRQSSTNTDTVFSIFLSKPKKRV